jgi:hypothetical protein
MELLTISSLILNVILSVLLFIKNALNDLIREYVLSRLHDRKHRRELLKRLSAYLETFPNLYFNWLTFGALAEHAPTEEERSQAGRLRDENHALMAEALRFIRENRYDFSPRVQGCLVTVEQAMELSLAEISSQCASANGIVRITQRVYDAIPALKVAVQAEIGKPSAR